MTAKELKQRGYCCGMGCKECPYTPKHQYGNTVLAETFEESKQFDVVFNKLANQFADKQE